MPDLYIANTTKQPHVFCYRHPEGDPTEDAKVGESRFNLGAVAFRPGFRRQEIKAGSQICIRNLTTTQIDVIVQQYEIYGIRDARQMSRLKGFIGFSYSVGKPVPVDAMLATIESNDKALDEGAKERLVLEAAEVSNAVAKDLAQRTGKPVEEMRPNLEVTHMEQDSDNSKPVNFGIEARRDRRPNRARN